MQNKHYLRQSPVSNTQEYSDTQLSDVTVVSYSTNASNSTINMTNSSPSLKRRNESPIWSYFERRNYEKFCLVEHCTKKYGTTTGNATLASHLASCHVMRKIQMHKSRYKTW